MLREVIVALFAIPLCLGAGYAVVGHSFPDASVGVTLALTAGAGLVFGMIVLGCICAATWCVEHLSPAGRVELQKKIEWLSHKSKLESHLQAAVRAECDRRLAEGDVRRLQTTILRQADGTLTCWPQAYEARVGGGRVHLGDEDHAHLRQASDEALSQAPMETLRFLQEHRRFGDLDMTIWKRS